eukprot:759583-Hanusia_phi.AAC.3
MRTFRLVFAACLLLSVFGTAKCGIPIIGGILNAIAKRYGTALHAGPSASPPVTLAQEAAGSCGQSSAREHREAVLSGLVNTCDWHLASDDGNMLYAARSCSRLRRRWCTRAAKERQLSHADAADAPAQTSKWRVTEHAEDVGEGRAKRFGREQGSFLALDLGGTNFRVLKVRLV